LALVMGALFTAWPRMWRHSSRSFAFGGVSPSIILGQPGSDCIPTSLDRFSKAGKTILDPSMRTVHSAIIGAQRPLHRHQPAEPPPSRSLRSPELNQWSPIPGYRLTPHGPLDRLTCRYTRREGRL